MAARTEIKPAIRICGVTACPDVVQNRAISGKDCMNHVKNRFTCRRASRSDRRWCHCRCSSPPPREKPENCQAHCSPFTSISLLIASSPALALGFRMMEFILTGHDRGNIPYQTTVEMSFPKPNGRDPADPCSQSCTSCVESLALVSQRTRGRASCPTA